MMDIKNEVITEVGFKLEGDQSYYPYFSALCQIIEKKTVEVAKGISFEDVEVFFQHDTDFQRKMVDKEFPLLFIPSLIFNKVLDNYTGRGPAVSSLSKQDPASLVCRCFGVYESEIISLLKENSEFGLCEITEHLQAGGGCTSCIEDLEEFIDQINPHKLEKMSGEIELEQIMKKAKAALKVWFLHSESLDNLLKNNQLNKEDVSIEFNSFAYPELIFLLKCEKTLNAELILNLTQLLVDYIKVYIGPEIIVLLHTQ